MLRRLQTSFYPKEVVRNRYYLADEGESGGGEGEPEGSQAPVEDFQVPDKFKGETEKESLQKAVKAHAELEKHLSTTRHSSEEIAEIKNTLKELRSVIESRESKGETPEGEDYIKQQRDIAKNLGLVFQEDLALAKEQGRKEAELDRINETLQEKYSGKDGKPTYDRQAITDFAKQNGFTNLHPEIVYKLKYEKELRDWDIKQALKGNRSPSVIEGGKKGVKPQGDEPDVSKMSDSERIAYMTERAKSYMGD